MALSTHLQTSDVSRRWTVTFSNCRRRGPCDLSTVSSWTDSLSATHPCSPSTLPQPVASCLPDRQTRCFSTWFLSPWQSGSRLWDLSCIFSYLSCRSVRHPLPVGVRLGSCRIELSHLTLQFIRQLAEERLYVRFQWVFLTDHLFVHQRVGVWNSFWFSIDVCG